MRDAGSPDPETMRRLHCSPSGDASANAALRRGELAYCDTARALTHERFLIADEMTAQILDPLRPKAIWVYVLEVCRSRSLGMLVTLVISLRHF